MQTANPLWYKDAIIYQLHVRAFNDPDDDGIGDSRGLTRKLDYLQDLGVTAIWLLPFYPSPLKDDGYLIPLLLKPIDVGVFFFHDRFQKFTRNGITHFVGQMNRFIVWRENSRAPIVFRHTPCAIC